MRRESSEGMGRESAVYRARMRRLDRQTTDAGETYEAKTRQMGGQTGNIIFSSQDGVS